MSKCPNYAKGKCDKCGMTVWWKQVSTTNGFQSADPLYAWMARNGTYPAPVHCPVKWRDGEISEFHFSNGHGMRVGAA